MKNILQTTMLEYAKSTFLIDLIQHDSGATYIQVTQTINEKYKRQVLKINASALTDLISVLHTCQTIISQSPLANAQSYFSPEKYHSVVQRYLKGVSIADLALQFNCPHQIIEQILFNKGIEIVKKKAFKKKRY